MDRTLKAFSLLLSYPTVELKAAMPEISAVILSDKRLTSLSRRAFQPLFQAFETRDVYDLEETFVVLFDRSRTLSLNLFEHVHGESRDRGGAMVSLVETYRAGGFDPVTSELPDHLPVLLEYLSLRSDEERHDILADAAHIFEALKERLGRRESYYAPVFAALVELSRTKVDAQALAELLDQPEIDPNDLEALDQIWEESEVVFGPDPNAGCPQVREMLSRMDVPINPAPQPQMAE